MVPDVGCPIEDIQSREDSQQLHSTLETFIKIKGLSQAQGYSTFIEKQVSSSQLDAISLDEMVALEGVWCDYLTYRQSLKDGK